MAGDQPPRCGTRLVGRQQSSRLRLRPVAPLGHRGRDCVRPALKNREQFVPQHLNLDLVDAISFDKGCYPGQEVVARMKYRGQVKFRTYRLSGKLRWKSPVSG